MVDVPLMRALLAAVPAAAAVLIVNDAEQLPSVGRARVLADIIASGAVPVVRLTEVFRQAACSRIVTSAQGINRGVIPDLARPAGDSDFYFVPAEDPETAAVRIVDLVTTRIPKRFGFDPVRDIQVLCPMNRGGAGARALNIELQAVLNPAGERKVERFGWTFAPGDKVMQIENDYDKEVYNGDIGQVADVDPEARELTARFDGREQVYGWASWTRWYSAYTATMHKSQGSHPRLDEDPRRRPPRSSTRRPSSSAAASGRGRSPESTAPVDVVPAADGVRQGGSNLADQTAQRREANEDGLGQRLRPRSGRRAARSGRLVRIGDPRRDSERRRLTPRARSGRVVGASARQHA